MGGTISRLMEVLFKKKDMRILMIGIDNAGKTTILYKLKLGEIVSTIPTIGFNVETVEYKGLTMTVWDIGGQDRIRPLWKHYYSGTSAIIFVVDSSDSRRYEIARQELHNILTQPQLLGIPLLVFANKQDVSTPLECPIHVARALKLGTINNRLWYCQGCIARDGDGLYEGLEWLTTNIDSPLL